MEHSRSTFSILFYLNTSKKKKSGKCPIMGRISVDGESKAFSTGMDILPNEWNAQDGLAIGKSNTPINKQIESYKSELNAHYKIMVEDKGYITAESLKNALRGIGTNRNTLMQEFAELVEEKRKSVGVKIKESTYPVYPNAYKHLKDFLSKKYNVTDMPFGQVDIAFVEAFALYLKLDLRMTPRTVKCNLIPFRTCVTRAKHKGLVRQDPFFDFVPEKIRPKRPWLTNDEIERLMQVHTKHATWNFTRDMFIFCVFTGITAIDLRNLKHSNIQRQKDGSLWVVLNRQKTGTASYIPLLDIPIQILGRYRDSEFAGEDGRVFKLQHHVCMNWQLKRLAKVAKIDKRLTFHMSRFTFATTVCLTQGVPIETLSQMMGHLSIKTTQIYAEVTRTKINEDMTNLADTISGKYELPENAKIYKMGRRNRRFPEKSDNIRVDINRHYQEVMQAHDFVTADKVKNAYLGLGVKQDTFLALFEKHNQEFSRKVGYNRAEGTYSKYCTLYKHMENYIKQEYKRDNIFLKELNLAFINGFEHYLRTERECSTNTIWMYMIGVKHIVSIARNSGQLAINPFAGYLISPEAKDRGFLNKEELNLLVNANMKNAQYELVRDLFVFSSFTGLSYSNVKNLTNDNLKTSFDGHLWIITRRQKTNTDSSIRLLEVPKRIIEKYKGYTRDNKVFPVPSNSSCNAILKKIAKQCGIKTRVTYHTARHSFATLALSHGVSIESISGMLGHTNITTTQIYAQITKQKIGEEMREFERGLMNTDEFSKRIKKGYDIYLQLLDTARRMKEDKFPIEQIIYYTGLSRDEVLAS